MRVLQGLDQPFTALTRATARYEHLCREQTAAKVLAAAAWYLSAATADERQAASEVIGAGIEHEKRLRAPGRGFFMYSHFDRVSDHYSRLTVRYLWRLRPVVGTLETEKADPALTQALREGLALADGAAADHRMTAVPASLTSMESAYATIVEGGDRRRAEAFILAGDDHSDGTQAAVAPGRGRDPVARRAELAYAAAGLLALGRAGEGLTLANRVTRDFNAEGRLYSTLDSVAAIAMLSELRNAAAMGGDAELQIDGRRLPLSAAAAYCDPERPIEAIEVVAGSALNEVIETREEYWLTTASTFRIKVQMHHPQMGWIRYLTPGDEVELHIQLPDGYCDGDLAHIQLPDCLPYLHGGGRVKRLNLDFKGLNKLVVPLAVTGELAGEQHYSSCVRNMFEEERFACPGLRLTEVVSED